MPDEHWATGYLARKGFDCSPQQAMKSFTNEDWQRLRAAYRKHREKLRNAALQKVKRPAPPKLKRESWDRLKRIAQWLETRDLDSAIATLDVMIELGDLLNKVQEPVPRESVNNEVYRAYQKKI